MVSIHRVSIAVILIISIVCFIFRFKRESPYLLLVPLSEAFALPKHYRTSNAEASRCMYITNLYTNSCQ